MLRVQPQVARQHVPPTTVRTSPSYEPRARLLSLRYLDVIAILRSERVGTLSSSCPSSFRRKFVGNSGSRSRLPSDRHAGGVCAVAYAESCVTKPRSRRRQARINCMSRAVLYLLIHWHFGALVTLARSMKESSILDGNFMFAYTS